MKIGQPSAKWMALKIAVLEPLHSTIRDKADKASSGYFAAFGLFISMWLTAVFAGSEHWSDLHNLLAIVSFVAMVAYGPVALTLQCLARSIDKRLRA